MRVYCKAAKNLTVKWDGVEYEFVPREIQHVRNYDTAKALIARNPDLVDWDEYIELRDKLMQEGKAEDAAAMLVPTKTALDLPLLTDPHQAWLDRAVSLGMRNVGRGTPKQALIDFCKHALGGVPLSDEDADRLTNNMKMPPSALAAEMERIDVLKGSSPAARAALEARGVEVE